MENKELTEKIQKWISANEKELFDELNTKYSLKYEPEKFIEDKFHNLVTKVIPQIVASAITIKDEK